MMHIVLHICMSIWTLSTTGIFHSDAPAGVTVDNDTILSPANAIIGSISDKLYQNDTYILTILLLIVLILRLLFVFIVNLKKSGMLVYTTWCRINNNSSSKKKYSVYDRGGKMIKSNDNNDENNMTTVQHDHENSPSLLRSLLSHVDHHIAPKDSIARAVSYPRAVQRNLIKGLATYNILHNPVYKESFAISWKFAMSHRRVRSVHLGRGATSTLNRNMNGNDMTGDNNRKTQKM